MGFVCKLEYEIAHVFSESKRLLKAQQKAQEKAQKVAAAPATTATKSDKPAAAENDDQDIDPNVS